MNHITGMSDNSAVNGSQQEGVSPSFLENCRYGAHAKITLSQKSGGSTHNVVWVCNISQQFVLLLRTARTF